MQDLKEYRTLVKKQIKRLSGPIGKEILKDEQAIGDIVTEVMIADRKHDPAKGRTRKSWLNQHAIYGTYDYINKKKKSQKIGESKCFSINENNNVEYKQNPIIMFEDIESVEFYLNNSGLNDKQKFSIEQRYLNNKKLNDIAKELNMTIWGVSLCIKSGIKKIRKMANVQKC